MITVFKSIKEYLKALLYGLFSLLLLVGFGHHTFAAVTELPMTIDSFGSTGTTTGLLLTDYGADPAQACDQVIHTPDTGTVYAAGIGGCSSPVTFWLNMEDYGSVSGDGVYKAYYLDARDATSCGADSTYCDAHGFVRYTFQRSGGVWSMTTGDTRTHIVDFTPHEGQTVTGPTVNISEHLYINANDLSGQLGVRLTLHNIDQNVLLLGFLSPSDITIFDGEATTSGDVFLGGNYALPNGNYRLNATLTRSYLYGFVINPFSGISEDLSHQFIVGSSTFIGTLTQNGYREFSGILASTTATSTAALARTCNPLSFDIVYCLSFLFVPGGPELQTTLVTFRDDVLLRKPWGYFGRAYDIFTATTTEALPSYTVSFQTGPPDNLSTSSLSFDPGDMLAGAAALLTSTRDPQNGKNMRDVFEPFVLLTIALAVLFTIIADLSGSHKHHQDSVTHR